MNEKEKQIVKFLIRDFAEASHKSIQKPNPMDVESYIISITAMVQGCSDTITRHVREEASKLTGEALEKIADVIDKNVKLQAAAHQAFELKLAAEEELSELKGDFQNSIEDLVKQYCQPSKEELWIFK